MEEDKLIESKKILTDYMLELSDDINSAEEWANTGADEEKYFAIKNVLEYMEKIKIENQGLKDYINRLDKLNAEDFYFKHEAIPKSKIEKLVYQLEQDEVNITKKYKEGKGLNCYLSAIDRVRIRAYRTKTKEIKERIQKLLEND